MSEIPRVLRIGAGTKPITVSLTDAALELLRELAGGGSEMPLADHRSILTTIVVAGAASGRLEQDTLVIDAADIRSVLDHARMTRV
ncbi:MAG: hypothetical protein EOO77_28905 [Oxalobacteraceae bacterium]|nr:MAG: hypothetical protein EOO77_28905 [Oxalobacteraceae bacterium]